MPEGAITLTITVGHIQSYIHRETRAERENMFFTSMKLSCAWAWAITVYIYNILGASVSCRGWRTCMWHLLKTGMWLQRVTGYTELVAKSKWVCSLSDYLPNKILVFDHAEVPAGSLGDPLPCHQVSNHHGRRTYTDCKRRVWQNGVLFTRKVLLLEILRPVRIHHWLLLCHALILCLTLCVRFESFFASLVFCVSLNSIELIFVCFFGEYLDKCVLCRMFLMTFAELCQSQGQHGRNFTFLQCFRNSYVCLM